MGHYKKAIKKPWQLKYYSKMVLFGHPRALNGQSTSTPNPNRGCQPALCGTGREGLALVAEVSAARKLVLE